MKKYLDYENYDVYRDGRIYSHNKKRFLSLVKGTNGYYNVSMSKNGISKVITLHRILATCFIPNPNNYPCINHIDGNKLNNDLQNLEWCTQKHNCQEWVKMGISNSGLFKKNQIPWNKGGKFPQFSGKNHFNSRPVNQYDLQGNLIANFDNLEQARISINKNNSSGISQCCCGKIKTYCGYIWRYADK